MSVLDCSRARFEVRTPTQNSHSTRPNVFSTSSVERVVEYLDLPQEPPAIVESSRPPAYWPSSTSSNPLISVEDLVIKYAPELPAVLKNVSFQLNARERVGLLGRTGSGKSTLAMSILRFVDPVQGRILIDGVDISKIGVHDLRSRLVSIWRCLGASDSSRLTRRCRRLFLRMQHCFLGH